MKIFGPVPSRRLGQSLGINNIPPKICSYSCVYCQVGKSLKISVDRTAYYSPEKIIQLTRNKVYKAKEYGEHIDYLTFVPDGEPTLDINLGLEIKGIKPLGIKTAVITNGSLLWRPDVRKELQPADLVSVKIDAADEFIWKKINHPHKNLLFNEVLNGIKQFAKAYKGQLITETMLVKGINDNIVSFQNLASYIAEIDPHIAYLSVPIRPPAFDHVEPADEEKLNEAFQVFNNQVSRVELLIGYEGNAFAFTGDIEEDILSITAVHPMREDAVDKLLLKARANQKVIDKLINEGKITKTIYGNNRFYIRKLRKGTEI
ncbi:MAG: radical SAM protein [Bacteroidales bacterium]|nr:radical SAM protein [Bacteroidales bacterium]